MANSFVKPILNKREAYDDAILFFNNKKTETRKPWER
jgi:hypothetical protein